MSKFCIDLEGVLLPDAIAAVVEAWYEAQMGKEQSAIKKEIRFIDQDQSMEALDLIIANLNQSPKIKGTRLAIERRGKKLAIRGKLPIKSNPDSHAYQRISLGIPADQQNAKIAEIILLLVSDQLNKDDFSWSKWTDDRYIEKIVSNAKLILNPLPTVA
jgi:hypothetical protein